MHLIELYVWWLQPTHHSCIHTKYCCYVLLTFLSRNPSNMVHLTSNESIPEHMTTFKPTSPDCLCQYVNEPVKVSVMKHLWHTSNCILLNYAQLLAPSFAIILLHLMLYLSQIHSFPQFPTFYLRYSELNLHSLL